MPPQATQLAIVGSGPGGYAAAFLAADLGMQVIVATGSHPITLLASDLALSIHPHPTLSETLMEAAEVFFGQSTHVYRPQRRRSDAPRVELASLDGLEETS